MGFLSKLFGSKKDQPSQSMTPELATQIIQEYGAIMQNNSPATGCVADVSNLPYPKDQIKKALIIGINACDDPKMKEMLKVGYIQLADWQEGVGNKNQGLDFSTVDLNANTEDIAKSILEQDAGNSEWRQMVLAEQETLKEELINLGLWKNA